MKGRIRFKLAVAFLLGATGTAVGFIVHDAQAANSLTFLVPAGTPIEGDVDRDSFTVTGQTVGYSGAGACNGGGPFPVQNGVVTPGPLSSGGATRLTGVIFIQLAEVPPGTKLHPLSLLESCQGEGGIFYDKWQGVVVP